MIHKLEADSIQLAFNGRKILSDIYLKCETGKITVLLGRNGQGKSCLMNVIYGIDNVSVPQAFKQPDLLLYLPQFNFIPKALTPKRIFHDFKLDYALFENRFPEFKTRYKSAINKLSGGELRLIEIYVIMKAKSLFAMLDEPFTHLDPLQIEKVLNLLAEEKENKGLVITDHMFRHTTTICDHWYVLKDGKTYFANTLSELETFGYARL
jgi:ABC-type lipopolysaccharide export system ATPase subunit